MDDISASISLPFSMLPQPDSCQGDGFDVSSSSKESYVSAPIKSLMENSSDCSDMESGFWSALFFLLARFLFLGFCFSTVVVRSGSVMVAWVVVCSRLSECSCWLLVAGESVLLGVLCCILIKQFLVILLKISRIDFFFLLFQIPTAL